MSKKLDKFNMIMDEAVTNFQKLNEVEKKKLLLGFPMFGKTLLKDLFEKNVFDTLSNEYKSIGIIDDTLYIALRKGEDKPVQEREIISIAKYKGDRLSYVAGSNSKTTVPMINLKDNAIIGYLAFLSDPLSAYVHHLLHSASVIHLQKDDENKLDRYSEEILNHIDAKYCIIVCMEQDFDKVSQLLIESGYEYDDERLSFTNPASEVSFNIKESKILDDNMGYDGASNLLAMLSFAEENQLKYKSLYSKETGRSSKNKKVDIENYYKEELI